MPDLQPLTNHKLLGAGRSGQVYLAKLNDVFLARKVFFTDKVANIFHYFFFGAPNPYVWNEDAIKCAYHRRKILGSLVQFWFDDKLKVADAIAIDWNQEFKAYQLDTEFIQGRHVALHQPFSQARERELPILVRCIMIPLQKHLIKAGLDGLVWQAGKGTPSALNNFLLEGSDAKEYKFVWIDLESGVPALFPLNPKTLFSFYLPKSIKYRRALFDDVNASQLNQYVNIHKVNIEERLGKQIYLELLDQIDQLEHHQSRWKSLKRVDSSIQYQLKTGKISEQQAQWYSRHPAIWYRRELIRLAQKSCVKLIIHLPLKTFKLISQIQYKKLIKQFLQFIFSQSFRLSLARKYVTERGEKWLHRKQITEAEAVYLLSSLKRESTSDYLNDFSVHLGLKFFVKGLEYFLLPLLYTVGIIDELILATWLVMGGPIYRTIYTTFRAIQSIASGQEIPWIAFLVGLLPTVGTLAYPCQIIYSATGRRKKVAQFILYDFFSRIGEKVPAWGGKDTLTEHFFNHCADRLVRRVS